MPRTKSNTGPIPRDGKQRLDLRGLKFARLLAIAPTNKRSGNTPGKGSIVWLCLCDCGKLHEASGPALVMGSIKSCGCLTRDSCRRRMTTHGKSRDAEYRSEYCAWRNMVERCCNMKHPSFSNYGARGIKICPQWLGSSGFQNFLKDVGRKPVGKSLDRINNEGNYEPTNVQWATTREQNLNRRNNRNITAFGQTKTITEWSESSGICVHTIFARLQRRYSPEDAVSRPVRKRTLRSPLNI